MTARARRGEEPLDGVEGLRRPGRFGAIRWERYRHFFALKSRLCWMQTYCLPGSCTLPRVFFFQRVVPLALPRGFSNNVLHL